MLVIVNPLNYRIIPGSYEINDRLFLCWVKERNLWEYSNLNIALKDISHFWIFSAHLIQFWTPFWILLLTIGFNIKLFIIVFLIFAFCVRNLKLLRDKVVGDVVRCSLKILHNWTTNYPRALHHVIRIIWPMIVHVMS